MYELCVRSNNIKPGKFTSSGLRVVSLYMLIRSTEFLAKFSGNHTIWSKIGFWVFSSKTYEQKRRIIIEDIGWFSSKYKDMNRKKYFK